MPSKLPDSIIIKFEAKGETALLSTIKNLDKATRALVQAQKSLAGEGKKQVKSQKCQ